MSTTKMKWCMRNRAFMPALPYTHMAVPSGVAIGAIDTTEAVGKSRHNCGRARILVAFPHLSFLGSKICIAKTTRQSAAAATTALCSARNA